ncbi:carbohydrate ABC transporter permease [Nonomuraea pusilla]|uniref:Multiple sugar transport system permease protein n=1 Tax=Nonomuraea pusilla TaxID=46177 RepID=A0A1H8AE36_9ACTN|nr:carbohydrate ABC transporter permease [Nonomuraea pusilla]SEM68098.1 multiple sugar transport system permease protein [Nonomuraea pusilla]
MRTSQPEPTAQSRSIISPNDLHRASVRLTLGTSRVLILASLLLASLGPFVWLFKASISTTQDTIRHPYGWFPSGTRWDNLSTAWHQVDVSRYILNSAVMTIGEIAVSLVVTVTLAYALAILRPAWGPIVYGAVLATLFIPVAVAMVPLFMTISDLPLLHTSLVSSYWSVWLPAGANAFNVLIMKRFMDDFPREILEAASVDGAGPLRTLWHVVLPLAKPMVVVEAVLVMMAAWKDYLWPSLALQEPDMQPISVALPRVAENAELSVQMAAMFIALVIPLLVFLVFHRQLLRGASLSGALKG